jgi:dolichyl-phosphate-mannose-protein mannosyltransferase
MPAAPPAAPGPDVDGPAPTPPHWPTARERLQRPLPAGGWRGWLGPVLVTAFAGLLRFWRLGQPHAFVFDETYYAKDGYSLLKYGYESQSIADANDKILAGHLTNVWTGDAAFVVHPPLGKWVIAVGIKLFGMTPFGWRFMVAVLGTLAVFVLARTARRMTGSNVLGTVAGFLLAIDGMALVLSRTAILDGILMFFLLCGFAALVVDRDRLRQRIGNRLAAYSDQTFGPRSGFRPFLLLAGIFFGMALATKWSALWFMAVFAVLVVVWSAGARRTAGVRRAVLGATLKDALPTFGSLVLVPLGVYLLAWQGWFRSSGGYDRQWAVDHPSTGLSRFIPGALRSLWHYHDEAYRFHVTLDTPHAYQSNPFGWLLEIRPVSFFYEGPKLGQSGCTVSSCAREVLALGTPAIWWAAVAALFVMVWILIARSDWRAAAVLCGVAAGWLPWMHYMHRTIFQFYAVVTVPFLVLAITITLGLVLGPATASPERRSVGAAIMGSYLVVAFASFWLLWPLYTAQVIPYHSWWARLLHIRSWV